jgi:FMN reductase
MARQDCVRTGERKPFIIGLGGTTRAGSSSEQALSVALHHARERGAETKMYGGAELLLPMYDPGPGAMTPSAEQLIADLRRANGIIFSSPCYHGGVSGLLKNAIDYVEELRNDPRVYFDGLPLGSIACGYGYQGPGMVLGQLRQIGHALRGWNAPLGVAINSLVVKFADGKASEAAIEMQLEAMATQVVEHARRFVMN